MISVGFVLALWSGSRAMHVFVDTITIMHGLGGHRGIVKTRALSFCLYLLAIVTGVVALPLVVAGPSLVHRCAARPGRLPGQLLLADGAGRSASASWRRSTTSRSRSGPSWRINLPGRDVRPRGLAARQLPAARVPHRHRRGLPLDLRPARRADRRPALALHPLDRGPHRAPRSTRRSTPSSRSSAPRMRGWSWQRSARGHASGDDDRGLDSRRAAPSPTIPRTGTSSSRTGRSPWWALSRRLLLRRRHHRVHGAPGLRRPRRLPRRQRPARLTRIDLIDSIYYTTVTLSTTGYGDIAPVAAARPADQRLRHHAAAHRVPGPADRHHAGGAGHPGPADVPHRPLEEDHERPRRDRRLRHQGPQRGRDPRQQRHRPRRRSSSSTRAAQAVSDAHADGLAVVTGDATRAEVLQRAGVARGEPGDHHHRPRRLQRAGDADRPAAQRRRLDRRLGARARERAADEAVRAPTR